MTSELILIVEDNDLLREGLQETLQFAGFEALAARNGMEALEAMRTISPALIVSDIAMPVMDGYDFYDNVRSRKEWLAIPFIFLTARVDPDDFQRGRSLGVDDYLTKPITPDELITAVRSRLIRMQQVQMGQVKQAYLASMTALANAIEMRDPNSKGHIELVMKYTLRLADELGWHPRNLEMLQFGAILHDIGKIHISKDILFKQGKLTEDEWLLIRRHPVIGAEMIRDVPFLINAVPIIRHHHEHWDGSGYPDGLSGKAIPDGSRILAVTDAFDAMTRPRPYKRTYTLKEAMIELTDQAGSYFDPTVIIALQRAWTAGDMQAIYHGHK